MILRSQVFLAECSERSNFQRLHDFKICNLARYSVRRTTCAFTARWWRELKLVIDQELFHFGDFQFLRFYNGRTKFGHALIL